MHKMNMHKHIYFKINIEQVINKLEYYLRK